MVPLPSLVSSSTSRGDAQSIISRRTPSGGGATTVVAFAAQVAELSEFDGEVIGANLIER